MKSSKQFRNEVGDPSSISRGGNQLIGGLGAAPSPHLVYLTPQHQPSGYGGQSSIGSPHHLSRDFHGHHVHPSELPPGALGTHPQLHPAGMPPRRRTSGHRLSLLRDIGVAGERDRAESSSNSSLPHGYTSSTPIMYGGRPAMTMMSSLGGLQHLQKQQPPSSASPQPASSTQHRHIPVPSGQHSRSSSLHVYPTGSTQFLLPGPTSIKAEPSAGSFIKEETKSPMHAVTPLYPNQLVRSQPYASMQQQNQGSVVKSEQSEGESMPSKESLLQAMEKVDKEIQKVTNEMKSLERKQQQLEEAAKKPAVSEKSDSPKKVDTKHKDLWQVIYAENKRKAEAAKSFLDGFGPRYDMPLYNQPSDTKVYHENLKKNEEMRPKLLTYFQHRRQLSNIRERYLCARYDLLMGEWRKRTERMENNIKRKGKETKVREFFEKQFPEIRKQREQQERFTRSGTRGDTCRSEVDFNEIVDGLSEQEHQEQHMRQLAVVPPMLLDRDERILKFINNNGLVTEPMDDYKKRQELDHWSTHEKQVFKEKYVQHPKNFHVIASFLDKKSVNDCVLYYYLSKKSVGYKALVRKNTLKSRKVKPGRNTQQSSTSASSTDVAKTGQLAEKIGKDSDVKEESLDMIMKVEEVERIDRPPSPRMTRSRNKNLNWSDEDISIAKEGFGKHGKDFAAISRLFTNKTEQQIKHFYQSYKKKHNLDQLIGDGKKRKPEGSRRTRTQVATPSSESSTTPPIEESSIRDDNRPKSVDLENQAMEVSETSKKRRKDVEADKKEDQKNFDVQKTDTSSVPEAESAKSTSSSTSQIRTRRSAVNAGNSDVNKSQAAKRATEATSADEPSEKKAKKVKPTKDAKPDKDVQEEEDNNTPENNTEEEKTNIDSQADCEEAKTKTIAEAKNETKVVATIITEQSGEAAVTTKSELKQSTPMIKTTAPCMAEPKAANAYETSATTIVAPPPTIEVKIEPKIKVTTTNPLTKTLTKSHKEGDGDSSATCSADEEPYLQDVTAKRHVDSPYAFEEESSASIKLETSRTAMPPAPVFANIMKQPVPVLSPTEAGNRPASTHAPAQMANLKQDTKRPQSLPPPHGAVPITTLMFNPSKLKMNNKPGLITDRIPDEAEFRHMLQSQPVTLPVHQEKPVISEPCRIDLTGLSSDEIVPSKKDVDKAQQIRLMQKPARYHPVPLQAESLRKDFAPVKTSPSKVLSEMPEMQHRNYTQADVDAMKERAAVIPVSSLRAPMPSAVRKEPVKVEQHSIKREAPNPRTEHPVYQKLYRAPQQPILMQTHPVASIGRSILTTSSVPTKFVSGAITSGGPHGAPGQPILYDPHRPEAVVPLQTIHQMRDTNPYSRNPPVETTGVKTMYPEPKLVPPVSRTSIVRMAPGPAPVEPEGPVIIPDDAARKTKVIQGSIMTGQPVQRPHEERAERMETILGKRVIVKPPPRASPIPDHARMHEAHLHGLRYPQPDIHQKRMGSILEGTPVVQRKHSDESNPRLSPANPALNPAFAMRHSPTVLQSAQKQMDRRPPSEPERMIDPHRSYPYPDAMKKEVAEQYQSSRLTPDKGRESSSQSAAMRRTPTGHIPQPPPIKKEVQSPQTPEEMMRRQHIPPFEMYPIPGFPGAHPDLARLGVQRIPLTSPGVSPDLLEVIRQYGRAGGVAAPPLYPLFLPGLPYAHLYPHLGPMPPPGAPGSPHSDDTRDVTSNMLNQDFKTAQLMMSKAPPTVPGAPPLTPAAAAAVLSASTLGVPPIVVTAPGPYHHLAAAYQQGALTGDRINFIPANPVMARSPFSPQFPPSGRSSAESSRSPSHKPSNPASPDPTRHRHSSGDMPREFINHPAIKGRNSPGSPFSHRSSRSPQRYQANTPQSQSSPTHITGKSYSHYPHPSASPAQQPSKSPHRIPGMPPHAYIDQNHLTHLHESHPSLRGKLGRTESGENTVVPKLDRPRPESAGPYVRSLPQSPNEPPEPIQKYSHSRQSSDSLRYRADPKHDPSHPPHLILHEQKTHIRDERPPSHQERMSQRDSPRPKHQTSDGRHEARTAQQQPTILMNPAYYHGYGPQVMKRDSQSPSRSKERITESPKDHRRNDHGNGRDNETSSNPGEDLRTCGKTKMKAGALINHIININFPVQPETPPKSTTPVHEQARSKPAEAVRVTDTTSQRASASRSPMPFIPSQSTQPAPRHVMEEQRSALLYPLAGPQGVTLARHSAEVIDQYYRQKMEAPSRTASPASKPTVIPPEPISPNKHVPSKQDQKPVKSAVPQFQPQTQRFVASPETRPRMDVPADPARPAITRPPIPHHAILPISAMPPPTGPASASLEDIIREALMTNDGSTTSESHSSTKLAASYPMNDMFLSHAALASLPLPVASAYLASARTSAPKQIHAEERKGQAANSQPPQAQSGSGKYMSALMFRSSQAAPPTAPGRPEQQYYQPPARHAVPAASQSPAPQDASQSSQGRQIHRPQYEALSDSD